MNQNVELECLDTRYEGFRIRDEGREARLLASIAARGIEDPLEGVDASGCRILLNGFKRYRCAKKLGIASLPFVSLAGDEAAGIAQLMRASRDRSMAILEEACFTVELLTIHGLSLSEVAEMLSRSKGWVSMRRGLVDEMGATIRRILFQGLFPVYSYLYTVRPFMRMNGVARPDIERFMSQLAGKKLSVREIALLAQGYFRGAAGLREAIDAGKVGWTLQQMKREPEEEDGCNGTERAMLRDLRLVVKYMHHVLARMPATNLNSRVFFAQAHLLTGSLLSHAQVFQARVRELHDRCGHCERDLSIASRGLRDTGNQPQIPGQPQHGAGGDQAGRDTAAAATQGQD